MENDTNNPQDSDFEDLETDESKSKSKLIIIGVSIAAVFVIIAIALSLISSLRGKNNDEKEANNNKNTNSSAEEKEDKKDLAEDTRDNSNKNKEVQKDKKEEPNPLKQEQEKPKVDIDSYIPVDQNLNEIIDVGKKEALKWHDDALLIIFSFFYYRPDNNSKEGRYALTFISKYAPQKGYIIELDKSKRVISRAEREAGPAINESGYIDAMNLKIGLKELLKIAQKEKESTSKTFSDNNFLFITLVYDRKKGAHIWLYLRANENDPERNFIRVYVNANTGEIVPEEEMQ